VDILACGSQTTDNKNISFDMQQQDAFSDAMGVFEYFLSMEASQNIGECFKCIFLRYPYDNLTVWVVLIIAWDLDITTISKPEGSQFEGLWECNSKAPIWLQVSKSILLIDR
jgi:hypothetical protein